MGAAPGGATRPGSAGRRLRHRARRRRNCPGRGAARGLDGRSLLPLLDGDGDATHRRAASPSRHPFLQRRPTPVTISTAEYAYVYWPGAAGARSELYHLLSDPRQSRDVLAGHAPLAAELRAEYLAWVGERNPEMVAWIEAVDRDGDWLPDAGRAWKGMI